MSAEKHTISKAKNVVYVPLNFTGGLVDLTLTIRRPNGTIFDTIIMTEESGGVYTATYTPDALGTWQEKVTSTVNNDNVIRAYDVVAYDAVDVKNQTDSIETKVDAVDGKVDAVQSDITDIKSKTDNLPPNTSAEFDEIDASLSNISSSINPGGYFAG